MNLQNVLAIARLGYGYNFFCFCNYSYLYFNIIRMFCLLYWQWKGLNDRDNFTEFCNAHYQCASFVFSMNFIYLQWIFEISEGLFRRHKRRVTRVTHIRMKKTRYHKLNAIADFINLKEKIDFLEIRESVWFNWFNRNKYYLWIQTQTLRNSFIVSVFLAV